MKYIFLFLFSFNLQSQVSNGSVYYQNRMKLKQLDSTLVTKEKKEFIKAIMRNQFNKIFKLEFSENQSLYFEDSKLDTPNNNDFTIKGFDNGVMYKDIKERLFLKKSEIFGKIFLIKDSLKEIKWILKKETKNIGDFLCFKAESHNNGNKIVAWYTLDIPVKNGPDKYGDLPGLILEVDTNKFQLLCAKISIGKKRFITKPKKGKIVTQKAFDSIRSYKIKELKKVFLNSKKGKNEMIDMLNSFN